MKTGQIVGIALIAIAVGLGYWGYQESQSLSSQISSRLSGDMDTTVIALYLAAVACAVGGLFAFKKG